jgi:hypothetical protein
MIQLPYKLLAGIVGGFLVLVGWLLTWQSLQTANAKIDAYKINEIRFMETIASCQGNREALEEKLDLVAADISIVAASKERLQGAVDDVGLRAREIAAARGELKRLEAEHSDLVNRAVPLDACQTYEMVLVALAGGSHVQ